MTFSISSPNESVPGVAPPSDQRHAERRPRSYFRRLQRLLTLWKDADPDPDIPVLKQAKPEYAKLQ